MHITLAHSPDADDAFMWWPLTGKIHPRDRDKRGVAEPLSAPIIDTGGIEFLAVPADIEVLNRRAVETGDLDITAISMRSYAHVCERYVLTACGASMGEGYGPKLVARASVLAQAGADALRRGLADGSKTLAIPGRRTTAFLTLSLMLGTQAASVKEMAFEKVIPAVAGGEADAGLLIHDAQLTFAQAGLGQVVDLGEWWARDTGGLPLPLGANAVRRDLDARHGPGTARRVASLLEESVRVSLERREESLRYVADFAPGTTAEQVDRYISMYVTELTRDAGERGRSAIERLLRRGAAAGLCPDPGSIGFLRGSGGVGL